MSDPELSPRFNPSLGANNLDNAHPFGSSGKLGAHEPDVVERPETTEGDKTIALMGQYQSKRMHLL